MMNWRKPIVLGLLRATGSGIPAYFKQITAMKSWSREQLLAYQEERLVELLQYAARHVPYYKRILPESGVIDANGEVHLEHFSTIPFLTKDILREQADELLSDEAASLKTYSNHSGGSTGEPTSFVQTAEYSDWNIATKMFYTWNLGKDIGEREMKIWGSDRDILEGSIGWKAKAQNWLYNRSFQSAFTLPEKRLEEIAYALQRFQPKLVWGYVDRIHEVAQYIQYHQIAIPSPVAVICAAGTLYEHMKEDIESAFGAPAINQYGGREAGDMACEGIEQNGLHVFHHTHYMETVNDAMEPVFGEDGEIVLTTLRNKAMPLIRYRVGDRGTLSIASNAAWDTHTFTAITGRTMQMIYNRQGDAISPIFFIHIIGVTYNTGSTKKFQIQQDTLDAIDIRIQLEAGAGARMEPSQERDIIAAIRKVMDPDTTIRFHYVDDIPKTKSGKFLFVIGKTREELFPS